MPHILVLFNEPTLVPTHPDYEAEREVVDIAHVVASELEAAGHRVTRLGINTDPAPLLEALRQDRPDAVFNLFEGTAKDPASEAYVAGLLDWLHIPYTGSPPSAMHLARDKALCKRLLRGAGLPTADFHVVERLPLEFQPQRWPVFVKPVMEDASVGIDQGSVVSNSKQLAERVADLMRRYGPPVLVEDFLDGREFNVAVIADPQPRALPISEILFDAVQPGHWPILTYAGKWDTVSRECIDTPPRCPADVEPALAGRLHELALAAFQLIGCRDYARIDFRTNRAGEPFILEVNPNPGYCPEAGFTRSLKAAGITHATFTVRLIERALGRMRL